MSTWAVTSQWRKQLRLQCSSAASSSFSTLHRWVLRNAIFNWHLVGSHNTVNQCLSSLRLNVSLFGQSLQKCTLTERTLADCSRPRQLRLCIQRKQSEGGRELRLLVLCTSVWLLSSDSIQVWLKSVVLKRFVPSENVYTTATIPSIHHSSFCQYVYSFYSCFLQKGDYTSMGSADCRVVSRQRMRIRVYAKTEFCVFFVKNAKNKGKIDARWPSTIAIRMQSWKFMPFVDPDKSRWLTKSNPANLTSLEPLAQNLHSSNSIQEYRS